MEDLFDCYNCVLQFDALYRNIKRCFLSIVDEIQINKGEKGKYGVQAPSGGFRNFKLGVQNTNVMSFG